MVRMSLTQIFTCTVILEILLDYSPSQKLWLFSCKRYNGILRELLTNNKAIEPQLMQNFLRDNFSYSLSCPKEFREEFLKYDIPDRIIGSVHETSVPSNMDKLSLPKVCKRATLDGSSREILKILFCKLNARTREHEVVVNTTVPKTSPL